MKKSTYNYYFKTDDGCCGVFNTFAGSVAILSESEEKLLRNYSENENFIEEELLDSFLSMGFLIQDDINELDIVHFDSSYFTVMNKSKFRILPTTLCNAQCPYCYEAGVKPLNMEYETAKEVCNFISHKITKDQEYHIEWFGGEPLMNKEMITYITSTLITQGYNLGDYSMVTNGILFDDNTVKIAKNIWKLSKVQITLDGLEETYNEIKQVTGIDNPFRIVCNNIKLLSDAGIQVSIRMNLGNNYNDLEELIHFLGDFLKGDRNIYYYIYPLFEMQQSVNSKIVEEILELNELLIKEKLMQAEDIYQFRYRHTRCFATCFNSYTVAPDGRLYNCTHMMGEADSIGSVLDYNPYNPKRLSFIPLKLSDGCEQCVFLPLCKGGCRVAELMRASMNQCIIYKNGFDMALRQLVRGGEENDSYKES